MTASNVAVRVFLVGLSGAGKSTVARVLADRLRWRCLDADAEIERRAGTTIASIFAAGGEPAFRELERTVVAELAGRSDAVIALGGGAFLDDETRGRLLQAGPVVWLRVSPAEAALRLAPGLAAEPRPLLGPDPHARLAKLLEARRAAYAHASLHIETDGRGADDVAAEIERRLHLSLVPDAQ